MRQGIVVCVEVCFILFSPLSAEAQWTGINFVDEFGEGMDRGAVSATVGPSSPMEFPYSDITARIFVNCDHAWMRFSDSPNLTGGDISDGSHSYALPVRIDGERRNWSIVSLRRELCRPSNSPT